jgi:hypothetical protein
MNIREYTAADLDALRAMHAAQGFAYALPDISDPLFLVRQVVEENSRPRMAALLRLTAEAYLLADPADGAPRVARAFGRRLETLGWRRDPWTCYTRLV